mmetsp:Transcript_36773/g.85894  ORF Transcript_36773/g.85894 Transcript_36773/m.85894 type:complete len:83 (+) Transcript_36773:3-251(+)
MKEAQGQEDDTSWEEERSPEDMEVVSMRRWMAKLLEEKNESNGINKRIQQISRGWRHLLVLTEEDTMEEINKGAPVEKNSPS